MHGYDENDRGIATTLPRPWEVEVTFQDTLYDWMSRAPWLALSGAAHLLLFFLLMAVPWDALRREEPPVIQASIAPEPQELFEPEIEEPPDEVEPEEPELDEPELRELVDEVVPDVPAYDAEAFDDAAEPLLAPFAPSVFENPLIGIGGGAAGGDGKYSGRLGGPRRTTGTQQNVLAGLRWLAAHQDPDGFWDGDGFARRCGAIGATTCGGAGYSTHDVGLTGLALLAFLGTGNTVSAGPYRDVVSRGMSWLKSVQDETGLVGDRASHEFLYDHAIATLALAENHALSKSPQFKRPAQEAVWFLQGARSPYGAWRYDVPPTGDADTSVTGWALFALAAARDAGLVVDGQAFDDGLAFLDAVTDPATGRVGYSAVGELSSRTAANEHFPREGAEAMTAVGLLCRIFLGQTPESDPILLKHAELLRRTPPVWDPEGHGCDMYAWYYGTYAAFQIGGTTWKAWRGALGEAVVKSQRTDGDASGSWDPVGPWGYVGGRVYATAMQTLTLEVYYRYAPLLGGR
jgi:hypothetical protein